ncbi:MAG: hypothetical protein CL477_01965 [Acidobacteria bacterium]|nr:hypothetical protein [Acidobacteriota bacterium]MDP7338456.1 hypothetical protein [Vicinamibacterales bacterium]HJN44289.1 hypothetical protein [Vicinamibacterales bacterium]
MNRHWMLALATAVAIMAAAPVVVAGQAQDGWTAPRTPGGRPDLGGIWGSDSATPLQRPEALGDRATLTDEEVAALEAHANAYANTGGDAVFGDSVFLQALAALEAPTEESPDAARPPFWSYDHQWMEGRWFDNRTSLIVDPTNGRLPPRAASAEGRPGRAAPEPTRPESVTAELARLDRGVLCRGGRLPMSGRGYNSNYQIFQTPGLVAIQMEMMHDTRLIPIGEAAPDQLGPRQDLGTSHGHWDGDTLVVETTNLTGGVSGSSRDVRLVERFTRVGPERLQYEFTVDDPSTWTQPWTARIFMRPAPGTGVIYEYACHEGNYAAELTLRSTRAAEAAQSK